MIHSFSTWTLVILIIDLIIAIGAISALRYLQALFAGVNANHELAQKDNHAFGLSSAGGAIAIALIMTGAISGEINASLLNEITTVVSFTVAGLVMLKIGMLINDKLLFREIDIKQHVSDKNNAAGLLQASNLIALGIIISAAILWVEGDDFMAMGIVFAIFLASQVTLLIITRIRMAIFKKRNPASSLQTALMANNLALAIRYAGHIIGAALAISVSSNVVLYLANEPLSSVANWLLVSIIMALVLSGLALIVRKAVLIKIDVAEEVDQQNNIGVAAIEAVLFIAVGLIMIALLN